MDKKQLQSKTIEIETTNICPASCVICPREEFNQKLGIMDLGLFKKIIDDASSYDIQSVALTGFGEPLADKLLFERCKYIKEKMPEAKIYISSTCFLMTPDKYDDIIKYIDMLKISIYGLSKETYEKSHRGVLKYEKTLPNILGFLEKTKGLQKRPHIAGLFVATDINKHETEDWIKFWEPKLDEVFAWMPHNFGGSRSYRKIDLSKLVSCGRPLNGPLYIHIDGKVSMCCFDFNKKLLIGDMVKQSIYGVYHSEAFENVKKAHLDKNFKGTLCETCDQINLNPSVLLYATNKERKVGKLTSNLEDLKPQ